MNRPSTTVAAALLLTAALTSSLLGAAACEAGAKGDPDPEINPRPFGNSPSLVPLNDPDAVPKVADGTTVSVTGLRVVAVDTFDETATGAVGDIFLQDATDEPGPYQGLLAFRAQTTPPAYRVLPGDVVDISGIFEQFKAPKREASWPDRFIPEIGNGSVQFRFDPTGPAVPRVIDGNDLFDADLGYQWRGMLVTIENFVVGNTGSIPAPQEGRVQGDPGPAGKRASFRFSSEPKQEYEVPVVNNELFDLAAFCYDNNIASGRKIKKLTGIVKVFGIYNIAPRSAADIELE